MKGPRNRIDLVIHPDSSPQYYSYYLAGFEQRFGPLRLRFSKNDLPPLLGPRDGLPLLLPDGTRLFIAADDLTRVNTAALEWCEVYGMTNLLKDRAALDCGTHPDADRITPIGPSFGIRWHSIPSSWWYLVRARAAGGCSFAGLPARLRAATRHQRDRVPPELYVPDQADPNYLFFISSTWTKHPGTISARSQFVRVARQIDGLTFEGGIVGSEDESVAASRPYRIEQYVQRTRRSVLAFNTPAVHECLGWKLGEFLALGKAIISLPISRALPAELEHGVHLHIIDGSPESMEESIEQLRSRPDYRAALEVSARQYFEQWLSPIAVVDRLIALARQRQSSSTLG